MCPPLPFHQHLTRLQSFQSNFRIFVHAHTLYGDNHPTFCFGIHSIGPQGCYVHRWNGYAGLCPPAHWLYAACPKNVAFSSIFALSPAEQAPSFFTCQGLFRRPISSSGPWAPSSHLVFDFSPIFNAILFTCHPCVNFRAHVHLIWPPTTTRFYLGDSFILIDFSTFHMHTCLFWSPPPTWGCHPPPSTGHTSHLSLPIHLAPTPTSISIQLGSLPSSAHLSVQPSFHPSGLHPHPSIHPSV